jgi:hypothetical protein
MAKKVLIIPSARRDLFPASQFLDIDEANASESPDPIAKRSRRRVRKTLLDTVSPLTPTNSMRAEIANRIQRALDNLGMDKDEVKLAIETETVGESTPWADLRILLTQLQDILAYRPSISLRKKSRSAKNPKQMELPFKSASIPNNTESSVDAFDKLMALMGTSKDDYKAMVALINKGVEFEKSSNRHKHESKLGRDPLGRNV